jgi:hypothetical protein
MDSNKIRFFIFYFFIYYDFLKRSVKINLRKKEKPLRETSQEGHVSDIASLNSPGRWFHYLESKLGFSLKFTEVKRIFLKKKPVAVFFQPTLYGTNESTITQFALCCLLP